MALDVTVVDFASRLFFKNHNGKTSQLVFAVSEVVLLVIPLNTAQPNCRVIPSFSL